MNDINLYEKVPMEENNFPIKLFQRDMTEGVETHWHEHIELLYFKKGGCRMSCGGEFVKIEDENIVVVNSNEHYFCHFFKNATSQSPSEYINHYRIEKALTLLNNTDISVTEIAMNVGFNDPNYFTRTFKKYTGKTPSEYRMNN